MYLGMNVALTHRKTERASETGLEANARVRAKARVTARGDDNRTPWPSPYRAWVDDVDTPLASRPTARASPGAKGCGHGDGSRP